jgi:hypothetical protein
MRLGPFLTTLAGAAGLELYGLGGGLVLTLGLALVVAVLAEIASPHEDGEEPRQPQLPLDPEEAAA